MSVSECVDVCVGGGAFVPASPHAIIARTGTTNDERRRNEPNTRRQCLRDKREREREREMLDGGREHSGGRHTHTHTHTRW